MSKLTIKKDIDIPTNASHLFERRIRGEDERRPGPRFLHNNHLDVTAPNKRLYDILQDGRTLHALHTMKTRMMKLVFGIILLLTVCSNMAETAPRIRRTHRHSEERKEEDVDSGGNSVGGLPKLDFKTPAEISKSINPAFSSHLVSFSTEKPSAPPWQLSSSPNDLYYEDDSESVESFGRRKRATPETSVCDGRSHWVTKEWARDIHGDNVTVLSRFVTNNNTIAGQYFFETSCRDTGETAPPNGCRGIDKRQYNSVCKEKKSWAYAMVRTPEGIHKLDWIAVKTSCVCALRRKTDPLIRTTRGALLYALLNRNWRD